MSTIQQALCQVLGIQRITAYNLNSSRFYNPLRIQTYKEITLAVYCIQCYNNGVQLLLWEHRGGLSNSPYLPGKILSIFEHHTHTNTTSSKKSSCTSNTHTQSTTKDYLSYQTISFLMSGTILYSSQQVTQLTISTSKLFREI